MIYSIFIAEYGIIPLIHLILHQPLQYPLDSTDHTLFYHISTWLHTSFIWFYTVLWILPIYAISFCMSCRVICGFMSYRVMDIMS